MPYTLDTAIREILRPTHTMQGYEGTHLTRLRFRLENGVWVRRSRFETLKLAVVLDVPEK